MPSGCVARAGSTGPDHTKIGDELCVMHAVLVRLDSIVRDEAGRVVGAEAVNGPLAEITW